MIKVTLLDNEDFFIIGENTSKAGQPGDQYFYDGWSGALDNLTTHLRDQKQ
jgi:hypothetical protein